MRGIDQQFFVMPLNSDATNYYMNNKAFGVKVTGQYKLGGREYQCDDMKRGCLGLIDIGRGLFNYQT
jgi:hypothetical protein